MPTLARFSMYHFANTKENRIKKNSVVIEVLMIDINHLVCLPKTLLHTRNCFENNCFNNYFEMPYIPIFDV